MKIDVITKKVRLNGIRPIMFDRYPGDNDTQLKPEQKMYHASDGQTVVIPSPNILSMLGSNQYNCATKIKYGKTHKEKTEAIQGFCDIDPVLVPLLRKNKPIQFNCFGEDGFYIDHSTARVKKGQLSVPNPKARPVVSLPWSLEFVVEIYPNKYFSEAGVKEMFEIGALYVGMGTWRGRYGKSLLEKWE